MYRVLLLGGTLLSFLISCEKEGVVCGEQANFPFNKSQTFDFTEQLELPFFFQFTLDSVVVDSLNGNQFAHFQNHLNVFEEGLGERQERSRFVQAVKSDSLEMALNIWLQIYRPQTVTDSLIHEMWNCLEGAKDPGDFLVCWEKKKSGFGPDDENDLEKGRLQLVSGLIFNCFSMAEQAKNYSLKTSLVKEMLKGVFVGALESHSVNNFNQHNSVVQLSWVYWRWFN